MALVLALQGTTRARRTLATGRLGRYTRTGHMEVNYVAVMPCESALEDVTGLPYVGGTLWSWAVA